MRSKLLLIACMSTVPFCINAQSFNTIKYNKSFPKVKLTISQQLINLSQELNVSDTLSDSKAEEILQLAYQRNTSLPLKRIKINGKYGYRLHPIFGVMKFHAGIDLASRRDTVYAMFDSFVLKAANSTGLGTHIELIHSNELSSIYGHLSSTFVTAGQYVNAGESLGITGSTGTSTGDHLHLTIKQKNKSVNPEPVLKYLIDSELNYWAIDIVNSSVSKQ